MTKRAIVWAAVSTAPQADENEKQSITTQKADGMAFAKREGFDVVDVLIVPGHSRDYFTMAECSEAMLDQGCTAFADLITHIQRCDFDVFICRDADRFGRKASLINEVVGRIVAMGATIYAFNGGWVGSDNYLEFSAMAGLRSEHTIRSLQKQFQLGMDKLAERGISKTVPYSHMRMRNEAGKLTAIVVDESKRRLFDDLATLLLEGVAYNNLERELYKRYGHAHTSGRKFQRSFFYMLLMNPTFWGHIARHHRFNYNTKYDDYERKWAPLGGWIVGPGNEIPQGVKIWYGVAPAVYTGDKGEKIRAEVMRRFRDSSGSISGHNRTWFRGLFVCGECGYNLTVANGAHGKRYYLKCHTHWDASPTKPDCSQRRTLHATTAQAYVTQFLQNIVDTLDLSVFDEPMNGADTSINRRQQLEREITQLKAQLSRLILKQTETDDELVKPLYDQEIRAGSERLNILTTELERLERLTVQTDRERHTRQIALDEIQRMLPSRLWTLAPVEINTLLHNLMQGTQFVVLQKEIIGLSKR